MENLGIGLFIIAMTALLLLIFKRNTRTITAEVKVDRITNDELQGTGVRPYIVPFAYFKYEDGQEGRIQLSLSSYKDLNLGDKLSITYKEFCIDLMGLNRKVVNFTPIKH